MNNFNETTIDYIHAQLQVFNEDFKRVADIILETTDIQEKKKQVINLIRIGCHYEILNEYQDAYHAIQSAYITQMEVCKYLPKDTDAYMHLWIITLLNAHLCYKLHDFDTAIEQCSYFVRVVDGSVAPDEPHEKMRAMAHTTYLDLARLYLLNKNKEKATEMLDKANGFSASDDFYTKTIDKLNTEFDEISFLGDLGDTYYAYDMLEMAANYKNNRHAFYKSISEAVPYDRNLQLVYLDSIKKLGELYKDFGQIETALEFGLKCKDLGMKLQAADPEDKEVLKALYLVNDNLNLYYRLSDMPEEELAAAIDRYHLQQLMQDDDSPMDEEVIDELAYDAYLLAQDSEKLGKKEQALKYYEQSLKWSEMLDGAEDSVRQLKEVIEGVKRKR